VCVRMCVVCIVYECACKRMCVWYVCARVCVCVHVCVYRCSIFRMVYILLASSLTSLSGKVSSLFLCCHIESNTYKQNTHTHTHTHIHTHTYAQTHPCTHTYTHIHASTRTFVNYTLTHTHTHKTHPYTHTHTHTQTYTHTHTHANTHEHTYFIEMRAKRSRISPIDCYYALWFQYNSKLKGQHYQQIRC